MGAQQIFIPSYKDTSGFVRIENAWCTGFQTKATWQRPASLADPGSTESDFNNLYYVYNAFVEIDITCQCIWNALLKDASALSYVPLDEVTTPRSLIPFRAAEGLEQSKQKAGVL